ncbi:glycosyltransferase [Trichormus sp. NMC-1]|uniref:glycosyltransferase n=1 Tax=Trichormus sp. NMC-1 TaxID=1853259 RepID=UPI0009F48805|nr:glycosyltransferase [Trichormus sp. NMC-1]
MISEIHNPIPILYLCPHGDRAGAERMLDALIRGHLKTETVCFQPKVICGTDGKFSQGLRTDSIPVEIHQMRLRSLFSSVAWLRLYLQANKIRLIHTTMAHYHQFAWLASRGLGVKCLWFNHGPCSARWWKGVAHTFPADAVVVEGKFIAEQHKGFTFSPKPHTIALGLENYWFEKRPDLRTAKRAELGLADTEFAIGILGRIEEWKRQHCFLDAISYLPPDIIANSHFFIAGEPSLGRGQEYFHQLKQMHEIHPDRERIKILGYVESESFLEAMDIVVHCAENDPFPVVILESMAKEKIVIGSNSGGVTEMITSGNNGFIEDPTSSKNLAGVITKAILQNSILSEMRLAAKETVLTKFNSQRLVEEFEALYCALVRTI